MFWNLCTDHLGIYDFFEAFLQNRQQNTMTSSNTDGVAHVGAPGVLRTAPACMFHHIGFGKTQGIMYLFIVFVHI